MTGAKGRPLWKRFTWFIGLWVAGVLTVGAVAYAIRFWIK